MSETMVTQNCPYSWPEIINPPENELCPESQYGAPPNTGRHVCGKSVQVAESKENNPDALIAACKRHMCPWCQQRP